MRHTLRNRLLGRASVILVVAAVGLGNAAYEAGNIAGAALALASITPWSNAFWSMAVGAAAAALLAWGRYKALESVLIVLVLLMSAVFLLTAWVVAPPVGAMLAGLFTPTLPTGSTLTVIALIGTTVVPYNLFLHANAVREKWGPELPLDQSLRESRWDTGLSIGLGGLITLAILSTAAMAFFRTGQPFAADSLANQLEPLLGQSAHYVFAAGLFAGGLTSAITAPLAAAYAVCGALGLRQGLNQRPFQVIWGLVLLTGTVFAALGSKPLAAIVFAQAANGFLLPVVALFLLLVMNQSKLLGEHTNGLFANLLGAGVVLIAIGLGGVKLAGVFGLL